MNFSYAFNFVKLLGLAFFPVVLGRIGLENKYRKLILAPEDDAIVGTYIIELVPTVANVTSAMLKLTKSDARLRTVGMFSLVLKGFTLSGVSDQMLAVFEASPFVKSITQDAMVYATFAVQDSATWGLDRIDTKDLPLDTKYKHDPNGGTDVIVYILDSGVINHFTEFNGRYNPSTCKDFTSERNCLRTDTNAHGTHCAGTVGSKTWGVAKNVAIENYKVLDSSGSGTWSGVISALDEVAKMARSNPSKKHIASMSLGGGKSTTVNSAVDRTVDAGVVVVVAAGNENQNACNTSPASAAKAITVGATTRTDTRASYSNWGSCVDIFAPGSEITSLSQNPDGNGGSATRVLSGTSMATPHVAGIAALYLSQGKTIQNMLDDAAAGIVKDRKQGSPDRFATTQAILALSPTNAPTTAPTQPPVPTLAPTKFPTKAPVPTNVPTKHPTKFPTQAPVPTNIPTKRPTKLPTKTPTKLPTTNAPFCGARRARCSAPATCCSNVCNKNNKCT